MDLVADQLEMFLHTAAVSCYEDEAIRHIERVGNLPRDMVGDCEKVPARL